MDDQGMSVGIEHIPEINKEGHEDVMKSHIELLKQSKVILKESSGKEGCFEYGPYNCIYVGRAFETTPINLTNQLAMGGRMLIPIGKFWQFIYIIDKDLNGNLHKQAVMNMRYSPLNKKEIDLAEAQSDDIKFHTSQ